MSKLNIGGRRSFSVGDLFDAKRGKSMQLQKMKSGNVPVIAAARYNQGVAGYYEVEADYIDKITVSCNGVGCGSTFYHDYEFTVNGDAIVLLERSEMSESVKKYISAILDKLLTSKYSYEEKCSADKAKSETIMLPVDNNGEPDRDYMENYIKEIEDKSKEKLKNLKSLRGGGTKININNRNYFKIGDLFDVYTGGDMLIQKLKNGEYPLISHSAENNGIAKYIDKQEKQLFNHNYTISLADRGNFKSFVQFSDFYIGTRVKALYLKEKYHKDVSKESLLFLSSLIDRLSLLFDYRDNATSSLPKHVIPLPVDNNGEPNWKYMNDFITNRKSILKKYLSSFS